ncbi:putative nuclease HARBI1 [Merluccius polli]|uniref:Nuclease HARBI1 n=1 Tax=Merluccius polli TaxID=89951 RepID=A0AA47M626_MERPO|nr:putative nuclease HARBI1 [Merluccius polli]
MVSCLNLRNIQAALDRVTWWGTQHNGRRAGVHKADEMVSELEGVCHKAHLRRPGLWAEADFAGDLKALQLTCRKEHMRQDQSQLHGMQYAGVVGAVDGTHIQIIAPSKDEDVFVNRKNVHSINTQIVFDATFYILDVAKWPAGSTRDPRILMGSGLRREAPCTSWVSLAG